MVSFSSRRAALRELEQRLERAESYEAWREAALEHDAVSGAEAWRDDPESAAYDASALLQSIERIQHLVADRDGTGLARLLAEDVSRHVNDFSAPELYEVALAGTKRLVGRYLDTLDYALSWLAAGVPGVQPAEVLQRFEQAWRVYGRSALLLSGGATLGFHHLGVVKALLESGLLPDILSGASTGAMIAAGVGARTDAELREMFADLDRLRRDGLAPVGLRRAWSQGAWLDPKQLEAVLRQNVGGYTFAEAQARTGRTLAISVSPTRTRQKPRLLSYLTAPDVLVVSAVMASSALPGLFPPVVLQARAGGREVPWLADERWVDGSIGGDLPTRRLARLHNVNHFVVSQTNPHLLPFVRRPGRSGLRRQVASVVLATLRGQGALATDVARRVAPGRDRGLKHWANQAYATVSQSWSGDIDLHPPFRWSLYRKVVVNPSPEDLRAFVRNGERSVWPQLERIRDQTRLHRTFARCVAELRRQVNR